MYWKLGLLGFPELSIFLKKRYSGSILLPPLPVQLSGLIVLLLSTIILLPSW